MLMKHPWPTSTDVQRLEYAVTAQGAKIVRSEDGCIGRNQATTEYGDQPLGHGDVGRGLSGVGRGVGGVNAIGHPASLPSRRRIERCPTHPWPTCYASVGCD